VGIVFAISERGISHRDFFVDLSMKQWKWAAFLLCLAAGAIITANSLAKKGSGGFDLMTYAEYSMRHGNLRRAGAAYYLMALAGNSLAQCELADMYLSGDEGTSQNYVNAMTWAQKSAQQGDPRGQMILGVMYSQGLGVPIDPVQAFQWMHKAAEQNWAPAAGQLAIMYEEGKGTTRDYHEALAWYLRALSTGVVRAPTKLRIGGLYENGLGTKMDPVEAYKWYKLASTDKHFQPAAHQAIEKLRLSMTPAQIAEGQQRFMEYLKSHPFPAKTSFR
jgi:hypothetical protein